MTSLKSIKKRRSLQIIDFKAMKNLKGGKKANTDGSVPPNDVEGG